MIAMQDFQYVVPELVLFTGTIILLMTELWVPTAYRRLNYALMQITLLSTLCAIWFTPQASDAFQGQVCFDALAQGLKGGMLTLLLGLSLYSRQYTRDRGASHSESYVLTLLSVLGMMLLVSAQSLLMLYLGLELMSLPIYALIAMQSEQVAAPEAAIKYFVTSGLSSGLFLYGVSLVYGVTHTLLMPEIVAQWSEGPHWGASFGCLLMLIGVLFKWGAVPFHMWLPDVYAGASTEVTAFIATVAKVAAFGMAYRILTMVQPIANHWPVMLGILALVSIALGNGAALAQTHIKRLLGYSAIAQVGFVLLGFTVDYQIALYYTGIYVFTVLGVFGVLLCLARAGWEVTEITDFRGLAAHHPVFAFVMMTCLLSLAGIPPAAGFYAKFVVLQGLFEAGHAGSAIIALLLSVIAVYYYLRLIWMMYFEPAAQTFVRMPQKVATKVLCLHGTLIWVLGLLPAVFYNQILAYW